MSKKWCQANLKALKKTDAESSPPEAVNWREWIRLPRVQEKLKFGERQAYKYLQAHEYGNPQVVDRAGVSLIPELKKVPVEERPKLENKILDLNLKPVAIKEEIKKINDKIQKKEEFKTKVKPKLPKLPDRIWLNNDIRWVNV